MPDVPRQLRAYGDWIESSTEPVAVRARRRPRFRAALAIAAAIIGCTLVATWISTGGGDDIQVEVATPSGADTTTTTTSSTTIPVGPLPARGIGVIEDGERLVLLTDHGEVLHTTRDFELDTNDLAHVVLVVRSEGMAARTMPLERPEGLPSDCALPMGSASAPQAPDAVIAAVCGAVPQLHDRVDVIRHGAVHTVIGAPPGASSPDGQVVGHWRWALPSPDGQWLLVQWSGECEVPAAALLQPDGSGLHALTGERGEEWLHGPESKGLGWTPDGRAIVQLGAGACGRGAPTPGVYAVDPETDEATLLYVPRGNEYGAAVFRWLAVERE